jgi:hypothetical protein
VDEVAADEQLAADEHGHPKEAVAVDEVAADLVFRQLTVDADDPGPDVDEETSGAGREGARARLVHVMRLDGPSVEDDAAARESLLSPRRRRVSRSCRAGC